jgi:DHA1 family purine ribonucleoside efflux pump-like MFS transporter
VVDLPAPAPRARAGWSSLVALAGGTAVLVASEFLPASVLPTMAADLGISEGTAGLAVAATAVAGAVTAPSIAVLLLGRLVLGVAIAGYWSFAFYVGTRARPGRDSTISTFIAMGVTVATIGGVPLSSVVGDEVGWRTVFLGAAALSALCAVALAVTLPPVAPLPTAGVAIMRQAIANPILLVGVLGVVLVVVGNFAAYPYIRVAIAEVAPGSTAWLLLVWGVGGVAGNLLAGRLAGRLRVVAAAAPGLLGASLALTAAATSLGWLAVAIVAWGVAFNMVPVATQLWMTRVEPTRVESALALQVTAFQVAITLGSAAGGALLDAHGIATALGVGSAFAVAAAVVFGAVRVPRNVP